jgi:hypothetical protein
LDYKHIQRRKIMEEYIEMFEEELKEELPCGVLHTFDKKFWLLHPDPLPNDEWEGCNAQRFLATPYEPVALRGKMKVYAHARHVVTSAYTVEYSSHLPKIYRRKLLEFDVDVLEIRNDRP